MFLLSRRFELLFVVFVILTSCKSSVKEEQQYASLDDSTSYAGIATCRNCHEDKYQTYIHTGMGMSFDHATQQKSSAEFGTHDIVFDRFRDLNYHPYWQNDSLFVDEFRLRNKDTTYLRTEKVTWVVGSGQHTNSHLTNINGYVYQVPLTFYTQKGQWDLPPGFENGFNARFSRAIGLECMSCHNAYPKIVPGSENKYDFVANGIDCERCHGPGGKHVKEKLAGNVIDIKNQIDYSIVNPAKLPIDLQLDVCQRCHIQGIAVLQAGKSFLDYRPAMKLSEVMDVYMPVFTGSNDEHIMASHAERMKMSNCFKASLDSAASFVKINPTLKPYSNAMTCVTCHDPHISVRSTDPEIFNSKCKSCHHANANYSVVNAAVNAGQCSESVSKRSMVKDNCITCHMPKNGTIDIPHVTTTDHWIRVPEKKDSASVAKVFAGLACINNRQPAALSKGNAFLSYYEKFSANPAYLDSAAKYINDQTPDSISSNFESLIRLSFLRQKYEKVIEYAEKANALERLKKVSLTNADAWTSYRIGEAYYSEGNVESAIRFYQQSVTLAPFVPDFRNKLAGVQHDGGLTAEARKNYEFIIRENPRYASAYINYGYLLLSAFSDIKMADRMYDMALSLDPDNIQALLNKAGLLLLTDRKSEAKRYVMEVLKRDKLNTMALSLMKRF